jgi:hypothetical protein
VSAELEARRTAAAAALADFRAAALNGLRPGDFEQWALRLATELRSVLEQLDADPDTRQLAQIRAVFETFDWVSDDRQYALEQIEDIATGGDQ